MLFNTLKELLRFILIKINVFWILIIISIINTIIFCITKGISFTMISSTILAIIVVIVMNNIIPYKKKKDKVEDKILGQVVKIKSNVYFNDRKGIIVKYEKDVMYPYSVAIKGTSDVCIYSADELEFTPTRLKLPEYNKGFYHIITEEGDYYKESIDYNDIVSHNSRIMREDSNEYLSY